MTIKIKPILKNRFWIVEKEGTRVATISWNDDRYLFSNNKESIFLDNKKQVNIKLGETPQWEKFHRRKPQPSDYEVNGYPTSVVPYNSLYDVKHRLPLFTKSEKSKSVYCAGYFIIKFNKGWAKSFCPKLITVNKYPYRGPFKTEQQMKEELNYAI